MTAVPAEFPEVTVAHGARTTCHRRSSGMTVGDIRSGLSHSLGVPPGTPALLDGNPASDSTVVLGHTEVVEFLQPAQEKG